MDKKPNVLKLKSLGIDTYRENIIFMHADCPICKSEGFTALTRVVVGAGDMRIVATLNVVYSDMLNMMEAGLSLEAIKRLGLKEGDEISITHLQPIESLSLVRAKIYGRELSESDMSAIISDVVKGHYSNIELAAFISSCAGDQMSIHEITSLTKAMISHSERIDWGGGLVMDKHCVGGLPGNRTTPIIVSIVAAAGLLIPKTSSRAITSPAGTADTMEVMTPVSLSIPAIRKVIEKEGGCVAWGGAVRLSPSDDILISVEKALDIDSEGQMIASVLSKKAAAGSTHVVIDMPVGATAKVRSHETALKLQYYFKAVADEIGLNTCIIITDGSQPVGRGIGPALEAMDVLAVLRNAEGAPADLKHRSVQLAGALLELSGKYAAGKGEAAALDILESGQALKKFMAICEAQGGFREPRFAEYRHDVQSTIEGVVKEIDNRKLARIAKLAGAPRSPSAGICFYSPLGRKVHAGDVLFSVYAESAGELQYVKDYLKNSNSILHIE